MPARLTRRQQTCSHPTRHVIPTIDPRYEMCQLCGLIRTAPLPAPWIVEYDESQPLPPAPPLFGVVAEEPMTYGAIRRRDEELLGPAGHVFAPCGVCREELPEELRAECRKCHGAGTIRDPKKRACPRCGGAGYIRRYVINPAAVEHVTDIAGRELYARVTRSASA